MRCPSHRKRCRPLRRGASAQRRSPVRRKRRGPVCRDAPNVQLHPVLLVSRGARRMSAGGKGRVSTTGNRLCSFPPRGIGQYLPRGQWARHEDVVRKKYVRWIARRRIVLMPMLPLSLSSHPRASSLDSLPVEVLDGAALPRHAPGTPASTRPVRAPDLLAGSCRALRRQDARPHD